MSKVDYKKNIIFSCLAGFILAVLSIAGNMAKYEHGFALSMRYLGIFFILWIGSSAVVYLFYSIVDVTITGGLIKKKDKVIKEKKNSEDIMFLISFLAILLIWTPSFFALYPGIFAYDNQWQYEMYLNNKISTHQPVLHTLLMGFIISTIENKTGSINKGVAAYSLFQMLVMALGLSYIPYLLKRKRIKLPLIILSIVFFAIFPVIVLFVFTGTKDSIFSVAVTDFIGLNLCLLSEKSESYFTKKKDAIIWVLLAFVILAFRSNAIYALLPMLAILLIYVVKNCKKKKSFIIAFSVLIGSFIIFNYPLTNAIAKEKVSKAEMMSVPCQQMARIYHYHYDEISEEDKNTYDKLFDPKRWYGYYVPEIADASKGSLRMEVYEKEKAAYWKLWFSWLKEYPKEYVDSILENTYGLFYMWPRYILYSYGQEGFTVVHTMKPSEGNTKIPQLFAFYEQFEHGRIVNDTFFLAWIFAPATYLYLMIVAIVYALKKKKWTLLIPFIFLVLFWMTFLLGPASLVRYVLFLYMLVPVYSLVYMDSSKIKDEQ